MKHWPLGVSACVPANSDYTLPSEAVWLRLSLLVSYLGIGAGTGERGPWPLSFRDGASNVDWPPLLIRPPSRSAEASLKMLNTLVELDTLSMVNNDNMFVVILVAYIE